MPDKNKKGKDTDPDVLPARGQESNENWDDTGEKEPDTNVLYSGESSRRADDETNTSVMQNRQK